MRFLNALIVSIALIATPALAHTEPNTVDSGDVQNMKAAATIKRADAVTANTSATAIHNTRNTELGALYDRFNGLSSTIRNSDDGQECQEAIDNGLYLWIDMTDSLCDGDQRYELSTGAYQTSSNPAVAWGSYHDSYHFAFEAWSHYIDAGIIGTGSLAAAIASADSLLDALEAL